MERKRGREREERKKVISLRWMELLARKTKNTHKFGHYEKPSLFRQYYIVVDVVDVLLDAVRYYSTQNIFYYMSE